MILMSVRTEDKLHVVPEVVASTLKVATNVFVKMVTFYLQMETAASICGRSLVTCKKIKIYVKSRWRGKIKIP